jgi:hypothetical protein
VPRTPGLYSHGSIAAQVDYAIAEADRQVPWWRGWPGWFWQVDLEHWGYDNVAPDLGVQMCAMLRARTNRWVVLYAPFWAYGNSIGGSDPLWASSYGNNSATPYRDRYPGDNGPGWTPYSGRVPVFWQYGSRMTVGSQPTCDVNAFRGSLDQLKALIQGKGGDMAFDGTLPSTGGRTGPIALSDLWNEEMVGHSGFVPGDKSARQLLLERILAGVTDLQARPALALTDAQVTAIAATIAAALVTATDNPLSPADLAAVEAVITRVAGGLVFRAG